MAVERGPGAGPPPPRRGRAGNVVSLLYAVTARPEARVCFLFPFAAFVLALILGRVLAPAFADGPRAYSSLFSTAAQMIVTLLVALALELRALPFRELNARRLIVGFTLLYVALGAAGAVLALAPGLSPAIYRWLFALTLAAGGAALLSVLAISFQVLKNEISDRRWVAARPRQEAVDPGGESAGPS